MEVKAPVGVVALTLMESGVLCHALMRAIMDSPGGLTAQPRWVIDLYEKLSAVNDKLMGKSR
ncbi:MAG: hypothetical protein NUV51_11675 [Sulfuricaulis sp.]|nr:hypothetical protein [Sulfuricaulis sp.]